MGFDADQAMHVLHYLAEHALPELAVTPAQQAVTSRAHRALRAYSEHPGPAEIAEAVAATAALEETLAGEPVRPEFGYYGRLLEAMRRLVAEG